MRNWRGAVAAVVAAAGLLGWAGGAMAQTSTIVHDRSGTMTPLEMDGTVFRVGQVVEVPAGYNRVKAFSFWIEPGPAGLTVTPTVRSYHATTDRYADTIIASGGTVSLTGAARKVTFTFDAPVVAGNTYLISLDLTDGVGGSGTGAGMVEVVDGGSYAGGNWLEVHFNAPLPHPTKDARFEVTFGNSVATVPTMTEWAMILMGLALAGGAVAVMMRRRAVA